MKLKKTSIGLASFLGAQMALAQNFPPPPPIPAATDMSDFSTPPPSLGGGSNGMMPAAGGTRGGDSSGGNAGDAAGGKQGSLSKAQQSKFAKAGLEDITNENFPETIESFDFPNVEITDVIKAISELTGKNFIIDPGVRGKITIVAPSKITVAEAYKAFLSALAINGFTVVPSGSFLKIKSARNAQRDSIETYSGAYYPNSDQMITRIIHLKHISAEAVNRDLRILSSKDGEMSVYTPTNSLILSDYGSNIDRVMKIINQLDVPGFEDQLEVINIKYAKAKDLADLVDKIVNKGDKSASGARGAVAGGFSAGVPRFTRSSSASSQQGASFFMAIPDDRTNSIIVLGNKSGIVRIKKLIAQLDFRIRPEDSGGVNVYYVRNGDAEKIAQTLQGVTKDAAPKPGGSSLLSPMGGNPVAQQATEIFGGDVKITADKNTNSLVITASKQDYETVLNILKKIDIARDQVFVESIIMEMSSGDANTWGAGYYQYTDSGYGKTGYNTGLDLQTLLSPTGGAGATLGFGSSKTVTVTDPSSGSSLTIPNLIGFINFLKTNTKANILSTPQILALDNQQAEIEVGDRVPVSLQKSSSTTGDSYTANFEDATIKLVIKPFISPSSNTIRMEVDQKISQPTTVNLAKNLSDNATPLAKRNIKTTLVIQDGDTAVLGGLMKDSETETIKKIPLLGDLPIIGWLFKGRDAKKEKVNLLVFLTPKIIRNPSDQKQVVDRKLDERLKFIKSQNGEDPFGETIDRIGKKTSKLVDDNNE